MARSSLGLQVDRAGVLAVQLVELRADLAPDARLLGVYSMSGGPSRSSRCLRHRANRSLRRGDVLLVAEAGVAGLQLQFGHVRRRRPSPAGRWAPRIRPAWSVSFIAGSSVERRRMDVRPMLTARSTSPRRRSDPAGRPMPIRRFARTSHRRPTHESRLHRNDRRPDVIRYGDLPDAGAGGGRGAGQGRGRRRQPDRHVHPRRHRRRCRCRSRSSPAATSPASVEAVGPGRDALQGRRPRLGLEPGAARPAGDVRRVLPASHEDWLYPTPAGVQRRGRGRRRAGRHHRPPRAVPLRQAAGRRDGVRQRRHRRRRLDGRADGEGGRGEGRSPPSARREGEAGRELGADLRHQLQDRRRRREGEGVRPAARVWTSGTRRSASRTSTGPSS